MRAPLFFVLLLAWPAGVLAQAPAAPTRDGVRAMLSGYEHVPTDAEWRRVGAAALPVLIDLYGDPSEPGFVRLRAVGAVAAFPEQPAARTFLVAVARADGQRDLFVREAVRALARGFGRGAVGELVPFLEHREPIVREAASRALAGIDDPRARAALRDRLRIERDPLVREALRPAAR